jgi:hypothetical protein
MDARNLHMLCFATVKHDTQNLHLNFKRDQTSSMLEIHSLLDTVFMSLSEM